MNARKVAGVWILTSAIAVLASVALCLLLYSGIASPDRYAPGSSTAPEPLRGSSVSMAEINAEARSRVVIEMLADISQAARDEFYTAEERLENISRLLDEMLRILERSR